jgi:hypothetical protein
MENTRNKSFLFDDLTKRFSIYSERIYRVEKYAMHRKNLSVHGEDKKRLLAYSHHILTRLG